MAKNIIQGSRDAFEAVSPEVEGIPSHEQLNTHLDTGRQQAWKPGPNRDEIKALQLQAAKAMQRTDSGGVMLVGCEATAAGLLIPDTITSDDMTLLADTLFSIEDRINLYVGDMLVAADALEYGSIKSVAETYKRDPDTLYKWKSVCSAVTIFLRRKVYADYPDTRPLTMKHFEHIMALDEQQQEKWLRQCFENNWSAATLRKMISPALPRQTTAKNIRLRRAALRRIVKADKLAIDLELEDIRIVEKWLAEEKQKLRNRTQD